MRNRRYRVYVVCASIALSFLAPSLARSQALEKFADTVFGPQNVEKYVADLSKIGEHLRQRETETQHASQRALTFLNLVRTAKSDQEFSILSILRPEFNMSWKYLVETGSIAGQQLKVTGFGEQLPAIYEQSKKVVTDTNAAAEFAFGEAVVVGPYGRSAGDLFRILQTDRKIASDDLERLANASKSGIIEKVEKMGDKELPENLGPMLDCIVGVGTIGSDILRVFSKDRKSKVIGILSVPGGVSQVSDCIQKLIR